LTSEKSLEYFQNKYLLNNSSKIDLWSLYQNKVFSISLSSFVGQYRWNLFIELSPHHLRSSSFRTSRFRLHR